MPTLTQLRKALAVQIAANVPGLRSTESVPATVNTPVAVVGPASGTFADYTVAMAPDAQTVNWMLRVYLIVSKASDFAGQSRLDAYLAPSGGQSVIAAISKDPTLGGVADYAVPVRAERYGLVAYNGVEYLGAEVIVEVSG